MFGEGGAMTFWPLFSIVVVVFSIFFYVAQFRLSDRFRGIKIASWAYPLAIAGAVVFAIGLHGLGIALFLLGIPFICFGVYIHLCTMFGVNPSFRRRHNWEDDQ